MTLSIHGNLMTSTLTDHQAAVLPLSETWTCTWCPDMKLDRNQAITAMTLAELVGEDWQPEYMETAAGVLARTFAGELGLTAQEAVEMVLNPPAEGTARSAQEGK